MEKNIVKICRSKQSSFIVGIIGLSILGFGLLFLYLNFLSPYTLYRWIAITSMLLAIIVIYNAFNFTKTPLILASQQGIKLNIALFGKSIFIPWNGVKAIGIEFKDPLPTWGNVAGQPHTKCLAFEIETLSSMRKCNA